MKNRYHKGRHYTVPLSELAELERRMAPGGPDEILYLVTFISFANFTTTPPPKEVLEKLDKPIHLFNALLQGKWNVSRDGTIRKLSSSSKFESYLVQVGLENNENRLALSFLAPMELKAVGHYRKPLARVGDRQWNLECTCKQEPTGLFSSLMFSSHKGRFFFKKIREEWLGKALDEPSVPVVSADEE